MPLTSIYPASATRFPSKGTKLQAMLGKDSVLRSSLTLETIILVGACLQSILFLVLPARYALLPSALLLSYRILNTFLITKGFLPNYYTKGLYHKRDSAVLPDREGNINGGGQEKVAVLLLSIKVNHPLGFFDKWAAEVNGWQGRMSKQLDDPNNEDNGFLGQSIWQQPDKNGAIQLMLISYWRSIEDVHAYAHGPLHRETWAWWDKNLKHMSHIGIMHEVFEAPAGLWETVYINFKPTLMGKTTFLKRGDKLVGGTVDDEWISPLVDASKGNLRTSKGRRGQGGAAAS